jgi:hypothetical protein
MRLKEKVKELNKKYGNIIFKGNEVKNSYCKGLTKAQLIAWGFTDVVYLPNLDEWKVLRFWYKNNSKAKLNTVITPNMAIGKHKYRPDKEYYKVTFSVRGEGTYSIPLSRFIYVWFNGDIPDGYVVDHIDNDSYNNAPCNLRILTIEENLAKRFEDNPNS